MTKHYATLDGIKRAAKKLKRRTGVKYGEALNQIARDAGHADFFGASQAYTTPTASPHHSITIFEFWSDRDANTRGNESRTFLIDTPLGELVKSHQLSGYLGGAKIADAGCLIGYGNSHSQKQARAEICRMARTLQFMSATGLKPSRGGKCYPKGDQQYRPPGADHDQGWYHPPTRTFLLTEEPYPGRHRSQADQRAVWASEHGWKTVQSHWGSIYGHGTELYLTAKAGGINLAAMARRLAALPAPFNEEDWPEENRVASAPRAALPVEIIEMSPELAAALKRQRDIDIDAAGPKAPELSGDYRGVDISSRWDVEHELMTMRGIVDGMYDHVRERVASIWCDSNANADYWVKVAPDQWYGGIELDVQHAVRIATNGYNGLLVEDGKHERRFDPEWDGDDYDYGGDIDGDPAEVNVEDL